jgi:hypothetical protein
MLKKLIEWFDVETVCGVLLALCVMAMIVGYAQMLSRN